MSSKLLRVVFAAVMSVALAASLAQAQDKGKDKGKGKGKDKPAMTALTGKLTVAKTEDGKKTVTLDVTGADGKVVTYTVVTNPKSEKQADSLSGKMVDVKGMLAADGKTLTAVMMKEAGKAPEKKGPKPEKKEKAAPEGGEEM
ncbi:MAG TPA: hypothetical protein P5137_15390 [Candidatus Brocadiia bacterium]|nr:hypothetical protein [Candidatus Brocadiia bacterium]